MLFAICVGGFLYAALAIEPPRLPARQQTEDVQSGYTVLRPDCQAAEIAKVPLESRQARIDQCAAAQEQFRLDRDGLTQAVRTTDATEEGIRLSFQQTRIAYIQALMTVLALAFTGWAAWEASRAARAAERSVDHAEKVMRAELRAYVHVERAEITWGHAGARPILKLTAKNTGQTPAKWFGAKIRIIATETTASLGSLDFSQISFEDAAMVSWSALGGGGSELSFYGMKDCDLPVLKEIFDQQKNMNVLGVLTYESMFGETFETQFWFTKRPAHRAKFEQPEGTPQGIATYGVAKEVPSPLQRAPAALATYRLIAANPLTE